LHVTRSSAASARCEPHPGAVRFAVVAQAVLAEACSRKEFFDELADNLEARSDRYTNQSGPGITALFVFQWLVVIPSCYSNLGRLLWASNTARAVQ
jgi:hypothetical protein